jgi:hypothetical protein
VDLEFRATFPFPMVIKKSGSGRSFFVTMPKSEIMALRIR